MRLCATDPKEIISKGSHENQIPYDTTSTYRQLNTTWVIGPDGKPWATGVTRGELNNFWGMAPLQSFNGAGGDVLGNLTQDGLLNSTDETGNINTGMRSLEKVTSSTLNPTDEDIMEQLKDIAAKIREGLQGKSYGNAGAGYQRYGGGGGGGFSDMPFMPFQNDMKSPYIDNVPGIYINNPNIQRAYIRRQRFSAERGRINQWQ